MYEVVKTHAKLPEEGDSGALQLDTQNATTLRPLATDSTVHLNKKAQDPELSCKLQISTVSIVVDLLPDTTNIWLGNVAADKWMSRGESDISAMVNAIAKAGTPHELTMQCELYVNSSEPGFVNQQ